MSLWFEKQVKIRCFLNAVTAHMLWVRLLPCRYLQIDHFKIYTTRELQCLKPTLRRIRTQGCSQAPGRAPVQLPGLFPGLWHRLWPRLRSEPRDRSHSLFPLLVEGNLGSCPALQALPKAERIHICRLITLKSTLHANCNV